MVTIAVDFDGTLVHEDEQGFYHLMEGAKDAMDSLRAQGFKLVIHTCRTGIATAEGRLAQEIAIIRQALEHFEIPFDEIYAGEKMVADFYIDDRCVPYTGNWTATAQEVVTQAANLDRSA